eukprot:EC719682.1.p1 GENE.EC719682.1~~EC719682.1.p1  ORF type:complete len:55 (+),score=5.38 EC719682.1:77-241(+)
MTRQLLTTAQRVISSILFGSTVVMTAGLGYGLYNIHQASKAARASLDNAGKEQS